MRERHVCCCTSGCLYWSYCVCVLNSNTSPFWSQQDIYGWSVAVTHSFVSLQSCIHLTDLVWSFWSSGCVCCDRFVCFSESALIMSTFDTLLFRASDWKTYHTLVLGPETIHATIHASIHHNQPHMNPGHSQAMQLNHFS